MKKNYVLLILLLAISCTIHGGEWTQPVTISGPNANGISMGMDAGGNAVVLWSRAQGSNNLVQASTLSFGSDTWTTPATLANFGISPMIAVTANGNAVATWSNLSTSTIQAAFYIGGSWSSATTLSAVNAGDPHVAVDSVGNAIVVWFRGLGAHSVLEVSTSSIGGTWSSPTIVTSTPTGTGIDELSVALPENGNAIVLWHQEGANESIHASTRVGGVWLPSSIVLTSGNNSMAPTVKHGPGDYAVALWWNDDRALFPVVSATQISPNVWTVPQIISTPTDGSFDLAVNPSGNAIAAWVSSTTFLAQASFLPFGAVTWTTPQTISAENQVAGDVETDIDEVGNAIAVWLSNIGTNAAFHPLGKSWQTPDTLSTTAITASNPIAKIISIKDGDYAVVSWLATLNNSPDINETVVQAVHGILRTKPIAPLNFAGVIIKNKFLNRTELVLRATWSSSPSSSTENVVFYRIYKNGVVVATISASMPLIFKTTIDSRESAMQYEIAAVSSTGDESDHIPIVILK